MKKPLGSGFLLAATAASALGFVASVGFLFHIIGVALTSPSKATIVEGIEYNLQETDRILARIEKGQIEMPPPVEAPKPRSQFINALVLHEACRAKQATCVVYIYGVMDTLISAMQCEILHPASREVAQETITALARLHSTLPDTVLEAATAASFVVEAFNTTEMSRQCLSSIKSRSPL